MAMLSLGDAFRLPWPAQVNPLERQLAKEGVKDLVEACHDAGMNAAATLCSEMSRAAARVLPKANWSVLVACHAWLVWFVLFDDAIEMSRDSEEEDENDKPRHQVLFDLLAKGIMPRGAEPFAWFGAEVRRRILPALSPTAREQFFSAVENYMLLGARPASLWRVTERNLDLASYEAIRIYDIGIFPLLALMEASLGLDDMSLAARRTVDAQRAWRAGARIVAWVNDIVSFDRELQRGESFNVLLLLTRSGLTPMKARTTIDAQIAEDVATLEQLRLSGDNDPEGPPKAYFEALTTFVRGCVDAHEGLERYADDVPSSRVARQLLLDRPTFFPGRDY